MTKYKFKIENENLREIPLTHPTLRFNSALKEIDYEHSNTMLAINNHN